MALIMHPPSLEGEMFRSLILCGCLAFATTGLVAQETQETREAPKPTVKQDFKAAGKNVGHASRKVGHKVKRGSKDVGHGFKSGAKDVGHGVKKAVDQD
jgi:hypothetical protein